MVLTCCLGGIAFLAILAIVLDLCFAAAMIAVIVLTRHGASSCKGNVNTPIGSGPASSTNGFGNNGFGTGSQSQTTYSVHLGLACKYNTASFACAIIAAFLFLCTAAMQVLLMRHHKKEKRYGPGPSNGYTSGSNKKKRFGFGGKNNRNSTKAAEAGTLPTTTNNRISDDTGYTGTTAVGGPSYDTYDKTETYPARGTHAGYYTVRLMSFESWLSNVHLLTLLLYRLPPALRSTTPTATQTAIILLEQPTDLNFHNDRYIIIDGSEAGVSRNSVWLAGSIVKSMSYARRE